MSAAVWRVAAAIAAGAFLAVLYLYDGARDELAELRMTATANEKAAKDATSSAAIAENAAVKQVRAARETAHARETVRRKGKEARNNDTYRTWADAPAPADAWRLLREAVPAGSDSGPAAASAVGTLPGNSDPGKRQ